MFSLDPEEKILLVLRHHWISILGPLLLTIFFFTVPLFTLPLVLASEQRELFFPLFLFLSLIWFLVVLLVAFSFWIDWYLDALVVTTKRIANINQRGLFRHEISEFRLERVQDVTIETPHFLATLLGYGNLVIQTAGEINVSIKEVPHTKEAKDLILKYSKKAGGL